MNTPDSRVCPKCGAPLLPDAPHGLCPQCLIALNFATETAVTGEETGSAHPPLLPEEIAPHFPHLEVLECLGRGGMGVVYKARQKSLGRLVALKLLAPEREKDPQFAERFAREAQALAQLDHPHIVTVHDFGQTNGFFYLLMEFVDGVNLRQLLRTRKLTPEEALAIIPPLCDALQFAHERGIVHRDIKPENLLLTKDGRIKIADFGIARMLGENVQAEQDKAAGTPGYMAPEQRETPSRVDSRADIYSLGVVFYELLTGELPSQQIEPPSRKVRVDVRIDEIVLRALEREPELRFQTAAELRTKIENAGSSAGPPPNTAANPGFVDRTWMKTLGIVLLALGIPVGLAGLAALRIALSQSSWNPSYFESVFTIGLWLAGFMLLGGGALLLLRSRPGSENGARAMNPWERSWALQPISQRRSIIISLALGALVSFVCFAWPSREISGHGQSVTQAFGFPEPWLKEIRTFEPVGVQTRHEPSAGRLSLGIGFVGMILWLAFARCQSADARSASLNPAFPIGRKTNVVLLVLSVFALAHAGLLMCAVLPVQPLLMMSMMVFVGLPALVQSLLRTGESKGSEMRNARLSRIGWKSVGIVFIAILSVLLYQGVRSVLSHLHEAKFPGPPIVILPQPTSPVTPPVEQGVEQAGDPALLQPPPASNPGKPEAKPR